MTGEFALREHTADVAVEATGDSASAVFSAVADGLAAAMCGDIPETGGETFSVERDAERLDGLLYDYLGRLIFERDVRGVLPVDNDATVTLPADDGDERTDADAYHVDGTARGVPLSDVAARDIKAVTYADMVVEERDDEWYAYVVFDV